MQCPPTRNPLEGQEVPRFLPRLQYGMGIDVHQGENLCQFIYKSNVDVAL